MQQMPAGPGPEVRLSEMVGMLGVATDLGIGLPPDHTIRTCLLSVRLGRLAGMSETQLADTYYLTLLRMLGCTADSEESVAFFTDEIAFGSDSRHLDYGDPEAFGQWAVRDFGAGRPEAEREQMKARLFSFTPDHRSAYLAGHCEVARMLASRLHFPAPVLDGLAFVFERWDGQGVPNQAQGEAIPLEARVMALANEIEVHHELGGVEAAVAMARKRSGGQFDPALVAEFCADPGRLMGVLDVSSTWTSMITSEPGPPRILTTVEVDTAGSIAGDFADLKSVHTAGHSAGVTALAAAAGDRAGLSPSALSALRFAAWGHDLGRVTVSTAIWNKPGPLNDSEWEKVRLHAYHSERLLIRPAALAPVAHIAGRHHERMNGSGYHREAGGAQLSAAVRILAAADCCQALTQDRAHRARLAPDEAASALRKEVADGHLDGDAVDCVLRAAGALVPRRRPLHPSGLSPREVDVLRLVAHGRSIAQAAAELHVAPKTVDFHLQNIYSKAGVSTRAGATLFAIESGILST